MLTENELKTRLLTFANEDSQLPDPKEMDILIPAMLEHIGTLDPELRDNLIYPCFGRWILQENIIPDAQCRSILDTALDDQHLLFRLGDVDTDSVFTRAFSALLIPLLLIKNRKTPYLTREEVFHTKDRLLCMIRGEKERRGYVEVKGWAHAVAHASDALDDLAQCVEFGADDLRDMLAALSTFILDNPSAYGCGEDQRMVTPVIAILRRGLLPGDVMQTWLDELAEAALAEKVMPRKIMIRTNVQNFLQALYFRVSWADTAPGLLPVIEAELKKLNPFVGN
jgi:hypothetical protein